MSKEDVMQRAAAADLVTLPDDKIIKNCTNCRFVRGNDCLHPKMRLVLWDGAEHMCCNYWDSDGVIHHGKTEMKRMAKGFFDNSQPPAQQLRDEIHERSDIEHGNKPYERFPWEGSEPQPEKGEVASPSAAFDVHQVDPARLKAEVKKDVVKRMQPAIPEVGTSVPVWFEGYEQPSHVYVTHVVPSLNDEAGHYLIGKDRNGDTIKVVWSNHWNKWKPAHRVPGQLYP